MTEKCSLYTRLDEAAIAAEGRRGELKGFIADLSVEGADRETLNNELLVIEGVLALANHLQHPGRPLSEIVDAPTLARLKAKKQKEEQISALTGGHRIPRIHNLGIIVRRVLAEEPGSMNNWE